MTKEWRKKLWMDFDRDHDVPTFGLEEDEEDDDNQLQDLDELRLDNHTASEEFLTQLLEYIKNGNSRVSLERLEIVKVMFTGPKAQLLADALRHPRCSIEELIFDRCRAKSDKMGMIFEALA